MKTTRIYLALLLLSFAPAIAHATPGEETTTLTTPVAQTVNVAGVRLSSFSKDYKSGSPIILIMQGCTSCTTANPVWLDGTQTYFHIGVTNGLGANKTNVSGHAVTVGGRAAECDLSPAQFRGFVIANITAGDPIARAAKDVAIACLGGS